MIVRLIDGAGIEARVGLSKPALRGQPRLPEELERPVHRHQTDAGSLRVDLVVELLGAQVLARAEEGAGDQGALACGLEARARQKVGKALEAGVIVAHTGSI
jgi:hypothetical protein